MVHLVFLLYTLVETAKTAGLKPRTYLHYLFENLPTVTRPEGVEALLPHRLTPEDLKIPAPVRQPDKRIWLEL